MTKSPFPPYNKRQMVESCNTHHINPINKELTAGIASLKRLTFERAHQIISQELPERILTLNRKPFVSAFLF